MYTALKDRVEPKAVPVRTADTDSEDGDVSHGKNSDGSEFEYLRYGAHISQYDTTVEICGPETMQSISKGCVHMQNLSQAHEHAMVIANSDVCRMILQTILGFQNDFFIFSSEGESDRVPRWIRSVTAGRSCLASCSVTVTGHLLEWFLGLADDVQYCRSIASAAIGACAAPISRRTRRHAPCSGFTMFDAAGMLTADVAACSAVCCDALLPLYAAAHSQCEALAEYVSGLERQLAAGPQGSGTALPTALTLHISMQSHRRLFAAVRAMIESTRAAYAHCLTQSAHGMTSGTNGSLRVNRRLYTPNSLGGGIDQADPDYHGTN